MKMSLKNFILVISLVIAISFTNFTLVSSQISTSTSSTTSSLETQQMMKLILELRAELTSTKTQLRSELRSELRAEFATKFNKLENELANVKAELVKTKFDLKRTEVDLESVSKELELGLGLGLGLGLNKAKATSLNDLKEELNGFNSESNQSSQGNQSSATTLNTNSKTSIDWVKVILNYINSITNPLKARLTVIETKVDSPWNPEGIYGSRLHINDGNLPTGIQTINLPNTLPASARKIRVYVYTRSKNCSNTQFGNFSLGIWTNYKNLRDYNLYSSYFSSSSNWATNSETFEFDLDQTDRKLYYHNLIGRMGKCSGEGSVSSLSVYLIAYKN